ncbi:MAG: hypothetical protein R3C16_03510 [Hyphomonadaceae bacterium]
MSTFEDLFRSYWWLIFPIFGMAMAFWGMLSSERRSRNAIDLIKSYVDQGKEPPPELLRLATQDTDASFGSPERGNGRAWSFFVFTALAAGFGVGWWMVRDEGAAFAFATVAVTMGVIAVGALLILLFGRK